MLLYIPLIYFSLLTAYFFYRHKCLNLDIAACVLLIFISLSSILIDVNDIYGDYGINENSVTLPTVLLYCFQWTLLLLPLHVISSIKLERHDSVKTPMLYILYGVLIVSSLVMIVTSLSDIRDAIIMDAVDMYSENASLREISVKTDSNYIMLLPQILTSAPFPTMALFFWFYAKAFTNCPLPIRIGLLVCSIVQAALSIITAGRAALIYWVFDFFLIFSYFYQYLSIRLKRGMVIVSAVIGTFIIGQMLVVTISRDIYDDLISPKRMNRLLQGDVGSGKTIVAIISMYINYLSGYQSALMAPTEILAIQHYENINARVDIQVNVFDTFGGEIYLDLGWVGYILMIMLLAVTSAVLKANWQELKFHRVFFLVVLIAGFTRGLFAWPFIAHYTTLALIATFLIAKLFNYTFKV